MKNFEISVLTANSRYLQTAALKFPEVCTLRKGVIKLLPTGYEKSFFLKLLPYVWDYMWNENKTKAL